MNTNTNYNQKNDFYTKSENNFGLFLNELLADQMQQEKMEVLSIYRGKSLPQAVIKEKIIAEDWQRIIGYTPKITKLKKIVDRIDSLIQNLLSDNVMEHSLNKQIINNPKHNIHLIIGQPEPTTNKDIKILSVSRNYIKKFFETAGIKLSNQEVALIKNKFLIEVSKQCFKQDKEWRASQPYKKSKSLNEMMIEDQKIIDLKNAVNNKINNQSISNNHLIIGQPGTTTFEFENDDNVDTVYDTFSKGYILNLNTIHEWLNFGRMSNVVDNKILSLYNTLKNKEITNKIYSFNQSENFIADFGPQRKIKIESLKVDESNIDNLKAGDLIFNIMRMPENFNWELVIKQLKNKKSKVMNLKNERLNLEIDYLLDILSMFQSHGYYVDLYRVAEDGRLYAQGMAFQNISKKLRKIIFHINHNSQILEIDQKAAQPQIIHDLSVDCLEKEILGQYLQNSNDFHDIIQKECGLGKKAFKKRRSCAVRGHIFENDKIKNSELGLAVLMAIKTLVAKLDFNEIIREERRRTFEKMNLENSDLKILVWLHDGVIVKKSSL